MATVRDELGRLDILVNNAGIIRRAPAAEHPATDWDDVMTVNVDAVFHLCQAAGRLMLAQGSGKIINIASMLSFQGGIRVPSYTAAKHAVLGLTRALANEWAGSGVNVNAIAPGYIATDNTAALRADPDRDAPLWTGFRPAGGVPPTTWRAGRLPGLRRRPVRARRGPAGGRRMAGPVVSRRFDFLPWLFAEQATDEERERQAQWQHDLLAQGVRDDGPGGGRGDDLTARLTRFAEQARETATALLDRYWRAGDATFVNQPAAAPTVRASLGPPTPRRRAVALATGGGLRVQPDRWPARPSTNRA